VAYINDPRLMQDLIEASIGFHSSVTGSETNYPCPFCIKLGHGSQSHLHVNYMKERYLCHGCLSSGSLIGLVRLLYGKVPKSLIETKDGNEVSSIIRKTINDAFRKATADQEEEEQLEPVELPKEFIHLTKKPGDTMGEIARDYLLGRDVPDRFIEEIGAGYAKEGRFKGYAIFPIYVGGRLVTFTSRAVCSTGAKAQHAPNSKSRLALFNYDTAADMHAKRVFIGEGPFDAWAFHHRVEDSDAGVALLGKVLHNDQARLLDMLPCEELVMCLDDTEHAKTIEFAGKLKAFTSKKVSYILLKEGSGDPHDNRENLDYYVKHRTEYDAVTSRLSGLRKFL
jgi:hypothetical protein